MNASFVYRTIITKMLRVLVLCYAALAFSAAMALRSAPDDAAVAEVLGTLSVRVAETLMLSTGSARA